MKTFLADEEMKTFLANVLADRREALLSLDPARMRAYGARRNEPGIAAADDETLIAAMHQARTVCLDLPLEERQRSEEWLKDRGHEPMLESLRRRGL